MLVLLILLLSSVSVLAQSGQPKKWELKPGGWLDTGLDVQPGDLLLFESSGELKYSDATQPNGPDGLPRGWRDLIRTFPVNDAGRGAVVGRINQNEASRPFLIGSRKESRMVISGRLFLGVNQDGGSRAEGIYQVQVTVVESSEGRPEYTGPLPRVTEQILSKIPRRVVDPEGTPGDRVNFLVVGASLERLREALLSTGWVTVDKSIQDTILRGALGTFSKQAYLTMPMSPLMVFERVQDYGFAMSDPLMTIAERHHFRVWEAPFTVEGQPLIVGAGTHDVGFDKDQRNGKVTHKIDPDTDKERDFIGESLEHSGQVVKLDYFTPKDTITKAKTAHGQEFFSDGRILIVYFRPDNTNDAARFSSYFCSVMKQKKPDGKDAGGCESWLKATGDSGLELKPLSKSYRVLVVPGILNTCVEAQAFAAGRTILKEREGLDSHLLQVPNESSEANAKKIADWIRNESAKDPRPLIVVGYSKGTPDTQTALALFPDIRAKVAAFISVAGASGGSPIADTVPEQAEKYLRQADGRMKCEGDLSEGMASLKSEVRKKFLSSYPHPYVPTYSVAAVLDPENLPQTAKSTWRLLAAYDSQNDGQLTLRDAIVPESRYLGALIGDHLGVALDMGGSSFPRAALFEALLRYVMDDLAAQGKQPSTSTVPSSDPARPGSWADGWGQKKN